MSFQGSDFPITSIFDQLSKRSDIIYRFSSEYIDHAMKAHDYGTHVPISIVEVHTILDIGENPGITATQLAKKLGKTKGALSQTIARLEKKGFITRKKVEGNAKNILLHLTPAGEKVFEEHKRYDVINITMLIQYLTKQYSSEEINAFFGIMEFATTILKNN